MAHSILPPSSAGIWGKPGGCTGSVLMSQAFPDTEGPEAIEGKKFHGLIEYMLLSYKVGENIQAEPGHIESLYGYTDEITEAAKLCRDDVIEVVEAYPEIRAKDWNVEAEVKAPRIHDLSYGTVDAHLYARKQRHLYVWDFKFGYGVVEVFENWQLINYAAALFDEFGIDGIADQCLTVHMRVIQPRAFHRDGPIREWEIIGSDLRGYFNQLRINAKVALSDKAETHSGVQCRYCSARHACKTALDAGLELYEVANRTTPINLSPEELGIQFGIVQRARKQMEYLESGLQEEILGRIRAGVSVPGWFAETGRGRERWKVPNEEIRALGDLLGFELGINGAITPYQARKLGIDTSVLSVYVETPQRGIKLVADDGSQARRIFGRKEK